MELLNQVKELEKLKRKEIIERLEKKFNHINVLYDLVSETNQGIAWSIWCTEFEYDVTVSEIKYALKEKSDVQLISTRYLARLLVVSDLIIAAFKNSLVKLESRPIGRKQIGIRKTVTITLPEGCWSKIDRICSEQNIGKATYFRNLILKEFDS